MTLETTPPPRRYDLDWLRIIAFILLIFYHTGMFYVTWDWHVKSAYASPAIEPLMILLNPWRLDLLFLISGVATRFMAERMSPLKLAGSRFNRLFWPLLFGMFVIVPPQTFCQLMDKGHYTGSVFDFYTKYITGYHGWCNAEGCLTVPTWNHLWYVAYLLLYSLVFALLWPLLKRLPIRGLKRLPTWTYMVLPLAFLYVLRVTLFPLYGETHALIGDHYVHAESFGMFLFGVMIARFDAFFDFCRRWCFPLLLLGLSAYTVLVVADLSDTFDGLSKLQWRYFGSLMRESQAWFLILALIGFARARLSEADGPIRRTLTEAIFPFYIIHQTIIVVVGFCLKQAHVSLPVEATTILVATLGGCWLTYLIVRAVPPLRPLFGLRLNARNT